MSRTERRAERAEERLGERLDHLAAIAEIAEGAPGRIPDELRERLAGTVRQAEARLGHGTSRTVVALAGATGSGKSSLFNALVGAPLAEVGVRRPTTSTARAAAFEPAGALTAETGRLLDWLGVARRHVVAPRDRSDPDDGADLDGLVLLDLPDHDSTSAGHRAEVDRLVEVVDAFVWVVDPQKYADLALHEQYLRRFSTHAAVTLVVMNQVDLVPADRRRDLLADLSRLLAEDGLTGVRTLSTSAVHGDGVAELRRELVARVAERRAVVARLDADLDWLADELAGHVGDREPRPVEERTVQHLASSFSFAAGADAVSDAVGLAHRRRARQSTGWPPTRWIGRLRADPLRRLGLDRAAPAAGTTVVARTSRPGPSAVAEAGVATALRTLVDDVADGLPEPWRRRIGHVAMEGRADIADALDRAVGGARLPTSRPRWWSAVSALQWLLAAAMAVGLVWLVVIGVVAWLQLPDLPTPDLGELPWPTALLLGGALGGILTAIVARIAAGVGARRRTAAARRTLRRAARSTAEELVVAPVDRELAALSELRRLVLSLHR